MSTLYASSSTLGSGLVNRFAASSFPPMRKPTRKRQAPKKVGTSLQLPRAQRSFGYDPMFASRHMRSYSQENLKLGQHGGGSRDTSGNSRSLYTPQSRDFNVARRTASWSQMPRQPSATGWTSSRANTPRSLPGIPWGQVPGLSGNRGGTISPINSEGCATSPTNILPKGHDYLKRAKLITKVLFSEAARVHHSFAQCFNYCMTENPEVSPRIGPTIRARLGVPAVYDVNLVLRPPVPSEAFEIVSTLPRDIAPGHAVARLNPSLSPAEKLNVKKTWGPLLLAEEYLTPSLVHECIAEGIQKAITSLDKIHIARDLYSVIPSSFPPQITLMVSYINMDTAADDSNSSFTINILPVIIAAGVPRISGFQLRMPMPHVLPFSRVGLEIMRQFDEEVQDWTLFWRLEGRHLPATSEKAGKKQTKQELGCLQSMLTKRSQIKKEKREQELRRPLPLEQHLRSWVISFEPLEERLLELCLRKDFFAKAKEAYDLFDDMVAGFGEVWSKFPPALTTSLKLWTIYKTAVKNRTVLDWLMSLLVTISECLKQRSCAYFLLPRINMLQHVQKKHVDLLRKQLHQLLQGKSEKNRYKAQPGNSRVVGKLHRSNTIL